MTDPDQNDQLDELDPLATDLDAAAEGEAQLEVDPLAADPGTPGEAAVPTEAPAGAPEDGPSGETSDELEPTPYEPDAMNPDGGEPLEAEEQTLTQVNSGPSYGTVDSPDGPRIATPDPVSGWVPARVESTQEERDRVAAKQAALEAREADRLGT